MSETNLGGRMAAHRIHNHPWAVCPLTRKPRRPCGSRSWGGIDRSAPPLTACMSACRCALRLTHCFTTGRSHQDAYPRVGPEQAGPVGACLP